MNPRRPRSHIAAMIFFGAMVWGGITTSNPTDPQFSERIILTLPYVLAAIAMLFPNRGSQLYCSLALLFPPAFLTLMLAKLLLTTPAPTLEIIPWVLVSGLLYWLFHAFALGKASRDFYKSQESVWLLDALKSIRSSKIFSQKNKPH